MSKNKKPRPKQKKQSAGERRYQLMRGVIDNVAIAQVEDDKLQFIDLISNTIIKPDDTLLRAFIEHPHRWNVLLGVSCRERNGKANLKLDEFLLKTKMSQSLLGDAMDERHQELIDEWSGVMDIRFKGWMASANGQQFDIKSVDYIFELLLKNRVRT